jgi:hypothetical protein
VIHGFLLRDWGLLTNYHDKVSTCYAQAVENKQKLIKGEMKNVYNDESERNDEG